MKPRIPWAAAIALCAVAADCLAADITLTNLHPQAATNGAVLDSDRWIQIKTAEAMARMEDALDRQKVHDGELYTVSAYDADVDTGEAFTLTIEVPTNTVVHVVGSVSSSGPVRCYLDEYVGATNGTNLTIFNNNRSKTNTTTVAAKVNATVSAGTNLMNLFVEGNAGPRPIGNAARPGAEWILMGACTNAIRVGPYSDNTRVGVELQFYTR